MRTTDRAASGSATPSSDTGDAVASKGDRARAIATLGFWHLVPLLPFLVLKEFLDLRTLLPEESYRGGVVVWEWVVTTPAWEVVLLAVLLVVAGWRGGLLDPWESWVDGRLLRIVVGMTAGALAWWFATIDVNPYFGETYLLDRILLVVLAGLVWWRPAFVLPLLLVLLPFSAQFHHPLGRHSVAQISLPVNLLLLFVAAHAVQLVTRRAMARHFAFLMFCMIAASYLVPGLGKLRLGWLGHRHVYLTLFASHSVGWLGAVSASSIETIGRWMAALDVPIVIATVVIECGAVLILIRRYVALLWLAMFVTLNTMILLTTGIFFWTWIVINATLLVLVVRSRDAPAFQIFSTTDFALSLPVILLGARLFAPVELAWLDTPVNYTYQLEATTESGGSWMIPTTALAPYDTHFALGDFGQLSEDPQLGVVWGGVHDEELAARLVAATTEAEIWRIERDDGFVSFDADLASDFDEFVRRLVERWNDGEGTRGPPGWLSAPRQVWTTHGAPSTPPDEEITVVTVHQVVSFFDGEHYDIIRRRPIRTIAIGPAG